MSLSSDLISQFAKITKDNVNTKNENTVYGTVRLYNNKLHVKIDGSDLLTPVSTTTVMKDGERVMIQIKDHSATVVGNISSPAARSADIKPVEDYIINVDSLISNKADISALNASNARITNLETENLVIKGKIEDLEAGTITAEEINAITADISNLKTDKLDVTSADAKFATIENLNTTNSNIETLQVNKLDATSADLKYANIDFSNINMTSVGTLFGKSGIIKDLVVNDTKITGELIGVTIKGDLIEGNTVVADKLVIKGQDGIYYKLNTDGIKTEAEQTEYNSLNGSIITTKSITASKISVEDLVAFGATIGGYNITENSLYSGVKTSATNTTRGVFFGDDGQMAVGDNNNFLKYFRDQNGDFKLEIQASDIKLTSNDVSIATYIETVEETANAAIYSSVEEFYQSESPTSLSGGTWSIEPPTWTNGKYIWRRTLNSYGDGSSDYSPSVSGVCITGNTGIRRTRTTRTSRRTRTTGYTRRTRTTGYTR